MKKYIIHQATSAQDLTAVTARWKAHEFFSKATVLGIDIGLEGIGICVRKGPEIVHAATWMIPWPKSLEERRAKRAWRHCRKNLKVRMARLERLCGKHGLPWFSDRDEALLHSDPFELRYRAITGVLASKEALSLAIRHIVSHRGHHYNYYNDEGEYPWGRPDDFKSAISTIKEQYLTQEEVDKFSEDCALFGWKDSMVAEFRDLLAQRLASGDPIRDLLSAYCKEKRRNLRDSPKGHAFPRSLVWRHLEEVIERHRHLIDDADGFLAALAVRPDINKESAIFYYHRKTPGEMREHFEKKTKRCAYAEWLGVGEKLPCDSRDEIEIRQFLLLEFLASRRIELAQPVGSRVSLPGELIKNLLDWQLQHEQGGTRSSGPWKDAKKVLEAGLKTAFRASPVPTTKSDFNSSYFETLRDLICPTLANRKQKSNLSAASAKKLFELATQDGFEAEKVVSRLNEYFKRRREAVYDPAGRYPQVEFLMGTVARHDRNPTSRHPNRKRKGEIAIEGRLQRLFADLAPKLDGKSFPDYCVIEVIGDPPKSERAKNDLAKEIEKRRKENQTRFDALKLEDRGSRTARLRLKLFNQQGGISPFTGKSLGDDPMAAHLQLCHLYPDSKGGLFVEENLVLAPSEENALMNDRTPRQAVTDFSTSWEQMVSQTSKMKWPDFKRKVFAWNESEPPDFGNTTRMSQLARQLYVSVGQWMGMRDIPDPVLRENRRSERVGTPSGFLTSVARASWNMPRKDREDLVHHMVDAVTLSFIPPGPGLNSVRYGGIFYDQFQAESGKTRVCALPVGPDPEVVEALTASDASTCPVVHFRSKSSKSSMHDQTLLGMRADGRLASRIPFDAKKGQMDVVSLRQRLINEGIRSDLIPADRVMEAWLESPPGTPFRLANGQRVRRQTLFASKEKTVFPGLGLVASHSSAGAWSTIKIFDAGKYQGAELWRVWVPKRKKWDFIIRRVPDRRAMESLLRICFRWFGSLSETERAIIPEGISARITKLEMHLKSRPIHWKRLSSGISARKCLKLFVQAGFPIRGTEAAAWQEVEKAIYGDSLPEGAVPVISHLTGHPARIVKGQSFLISVTSGGKRAEPGRPTEKHWYRVSSIKGDGGIKIKALRMREWDEMVLSKVDVAALFGAKPSDDPPSDPSE